MPCSQQIHSAVLWVGPAAAVFILAVDVAAGAVAEAAVVPAAAGAAAAGEAPPAGIPAARAAAASVAAAAQRQQQQQQQQQQIQHEHQVVPIWLLWPVSICCVVQGKSAEGAPVVTVNADRNVFGFGCGLLEIIERASKEFIPLYKDDKVTPHPLMRRTPVGPSIAVMLGAATERGAWQSTMGTWLCAVVCHSTCCKLPAALMILQCT